VSPKSAPALRDVRRGRDPDVIELTDEHGRVVLLHAHGLNPDEQGRMRERIFALLAPLVEHPK
jgi:hypothetical protein